jgi:glycosyltransferase involved in cell wall biosynthesis
MRAHLKHKHPGAGAILSVKSAEEMVEMQGHLEGVNVMVGMLSWDNGPTVSAESLQSIADECRRLDSVGARAEFMAVDNGSRDGSAASMGEVIHRGGTGFLLINDRNMGNSIARNAVIRQGLSRGAGYIAFVDGDIEVVPWSLYAMLKYLVDSNAGCLGANSASCTNVREKVDRDCAYIPESFIKADVRCAWTQYGVFRSDMFLEGIRFEERGPFGGPGWGMEDVDLYVQMKVAGYRCEYFSGMVYLHRDRNSSIPLLERDGVDPQEAYDSRKAYLVNKWMRVKEAQFIRSMDGRVPRKGYATGKSVAKA